MGLAQRPDVFKVSSVFFFLFKPQHFLSYSSQFESSLCLWVRRSLVGLTKC